MRRLALLFLLSTAACTVSGGEDLPDDVEYDALDLEDMEGKADGLVFDRNRIVSDEAFFDESAMSASEVQTFLEHTPYGKRSFLADLWMADGQRLSTALVRVAADHDLNPLVLLVTLQKEAGLISKSKAPSRSRIDYAFGCGCPDGRACSSSYRGLDRQLQCAAEHLREYANDIEAGGTTVSGFAPGVTKSVLDGVRVTPVNIATAVLYTYTPWILPNTGGNWLFWNVWARYSLHTGTPVERPPFNEGFIGGACSADDQCYYEGGVCRGGICSLDCDSICPDRSGSYATTFCVSALNLGGSLTEGTCVAQCDTALSASGCGVGQKCVRQQRFNDSSTVRNVCVPE